MPRNSLVARLPRLAFTALAYSVAGRSMHLAQTAPELIEGPVEIAWTSAHGFQAPGSNSAVGCARSGDRAFVAATTFGYDTQTDISVVCWNVPTGTPIWKAHYEGGAGHSAAAADVAVSTDGARMYVCGVYDGGFPFGGIGHPLTLCFDAATGVLLWSAVEFDLVGGRHQGVVVSPDGARVFCVGYQLAAIAAPATALTSAFDSGTGARMWLDIHTLPGSTEIANDVATSPSGDRVYTAGSTHKSGSAGFVTRALDPVTGAELWTASVLAPGVAEGGNALAVTPDGSAIYVAGRAGSTFLLGYAPDGTSLGWSGSGTSFTGGALSLSADASRVYVAGLAYPTGFEPSVFRVACFSSSGTALWTTTFAPTPGFSGAARDVGEVAGVAVATGWLGPSYGTADLAVVGIDAASGAVLWSDHGVTSGVAVAVRPDAADVLVCGTTYVPATADDIAFRRYAASTGSILDADTVDLEIPAAEEVTASCRSADGRWLLTAGTSLGGSGTKRAFAAILDSSTGGQIGQWTLSGSAPGGTEALAAAADPVLSVAYVGGRADDVSFVAALDAATSAPIWTQFAPPLLGAMDAVHALAVSPDGSRLFAAGTSKGGVVFLRALSPTTGAVLWETTLGRMAEVAPRLTVDPHGQRVFLLASAIGANDVHLVTAAYRADSGTLVWQAHDQAPGDGSGAVIQTARALAVSPDGTLVVAAGDSGTTLQHVRALGYETSSGAVRFAVAHDGPGNLGDSVREAAFSTRGDRVYLGCRTDLGPSFLPQGDWLVLALDTATGALDWTSWLGLAGADDDLRDLEPDPDGSKVYAVGSLSEFLSIGHFAAMALDAGTGKRLWLAEYLGSYGKDGARRVLVDAGERRAYALGEFSGMSATLDVGAIAYDLPDLTADSASVSVSTGGTVELDLSGGPALGGARFLILGSTSGVAPGLSIGGLVLPLNPDGYFLYTLDHPGAPPLSGSLGALDAHGAHEALFTVPASSDPSLAGTSVAHAFLAFQAGLPVLASNAVTIALVP